MTVLSKPMKFFLRMVYNTPEHVGEIWLIYINTHTHTHTHTHTYIYIYIYVWSKYIMCACWSIEKLINTIKLNSIKFCAREFTGKFPDEFEFWFFIFVVICNIISY